jgi:hypothetical protein
VKIHQLSIIGDGDLDNIYPFFILEKLLFEYHNDLIFWGYVVDTSLETTIFK